LVIGHWSLVIESAPGALLIARPWPDFESHQR
jgi:hypothetical protein